MAYKKPTDEVRNILGTYARNKRGDHIQVTAISDSTGISYDIRNMYTNDNDELCFTQKGVRVKSDMMADIIVAVLNHMSPEEFNEIMKKVDTGEI